MDFAQPPEFDDIREAIRNLCAAFPGAYWRDLKPDSYLEEFVAALWAPEANMAELHTSDVSWSAATACLDGHGGPGSATEVNIERKFRETRLHQTAPVSNNPALAYLGNNVLCMPRSC